jgi:hypothetical protein
MTASVISFTPSVSSFASDSVAFASSSFASDSVTFASSSFASDSVTFASSFASDSVSFVSSSFASDSVSFVSSSFVSDSGVVSNSSIDAVIDSGSFASNHGGTSPPSSADKGDSVSSIASLVADSDTSLFNSDVLLFSDYIFIKII